MRNVTRFGAWLIASLPLILLGPALASPAPPHQARSDSGLQACVGAWRVVASPSVDGSSNYLNSVAAISSSLR